MICSQFPFRLAAASTVAAAAGLMATPSHADYLQTFDNNAGANLNFNAFDSASEDWSSYLYRGGTATQAVGSVAAGSPAANIGVGSVAGVANTPGYAFTSNGQTGDTYSYFATIESIDADAISWYQASNSDVTTQLLVQSGGNWYVSTQAWDDDDVTGSGAAELQDEPGAGDSLISVAYSTAAANWLNFTPTSGTPVGSAAGSDLAGTVTGIGFYIAGTNSTSRIDNVAITAAVPEPSSMALLGLSGVCLLARRRR